MCVVLGDLPLTDRSNDHTITHQFSEAHRLQFTDLVRFRNFYFAKLCAVLLSEINNCSIPMWLVQLFPDENASRASM